MSDLLKNTEACRIREIPNFSLPKDAKVVINLTLDFDVTVYRRFLREPRLWVAQGEFGGRVAVWRYLDMFRELGIKATFYVPGQAALLYPEAVKRMAEEGHEVGNHMWNHVIPPTLEEEKEDIRKTDAILKRLTGAYPVGTRSEHDFAALEDHEYSYFSYTPQGEVPFYVWSASIGKWVLNLPMSFIYDDAMFFYFGWFGSKNTQQRVQAPSSFLEVLLEAYAVARETTGYMNICLHPNISGRSCRIGVIRDFLAQTVNDEGTLYTTSAWFAEYILKNFPAGE